MLYLSRALYGLFYIKDYSIYYDYSIYFVVFIS